MTYLLDCGADATLVTDDGLDAKQLAQSFGNQQAIAALDEAAGEGGGGGGCFGGGARKKKKRYSARVHAV